jgi:hypothetical protein
LLLRSVETRYREIGESDRKGSGEIDIDAAEIDAGVTDAEKNKL